MDEFTLWGVHREGSHSPGRESDDRRILNAVAARLEGMGVMDVRTFDPHELPPAPGALPHLVFFMCESRRILPRLADWEARGVAMVNPLRGVLNTYRTETVGLLRSERFFPATRFVSTDAPASIDLERELPSRVWVKRGDYHAVCPDDVLQAATGKALADALERFRERGIPRVVVQEHVEGDLIKFYGVRDQAAHTARWFTWFHHADQVRRNYPVDEARLRRICERGARRLGLEVFGGDVIVTASGELFAIDFNAWPSFALYRDQAADHIARHILDRCAGGAHSLAAVSEAVAP